MLDFTELPQDGTSFEQLARELLLVAGLRPHWTGKGPDQGRDLIAEETATGPLGSFKRTWLVQCKHLAHSKHSVGRNDVKSIIDDCRQVNADGYLLVCSTQPSSSLVQKLNEITSAPENRLVATVWDAVEIEKRLGEPRGFSLSHIFFPASMKDTPWKIYNVGSPTKWAAHYKKYFLYLSCRDAARFPSLAEVELIISRLEEIRPKNDNELVRPRAVYYDDKHEQFFVFADYLVPCDSTPSLSPAEFEGKLQDWHGLHSDGKSSWYSTGWDIKKVETDPLSDDHYQFDHADYYEMYLRNFERGAFRGPTIGILASIDQWL